MAARVSIIGGSGAMGRGLTLRLARAGVEVVLGSRDPERGAQVAAEYAADLPPGAAQVTGGGNAWAASRAPVLLLSVPYDALDATLEELKGLPAGTVVVSLVNPLAFDGRGAYPVPVPDGSAAEQIAGRLPQVEVVAAFHTVAGPVLAEVERLVDEDVLIAGDDPDAVQQVVAIAECLEGVRGVEVGPLRLAAVLEALTPVLIGVNRRYRTHAGLRVTRLPVD